nr:hypothetical protein [uncultured Glaciecola sp.]
MNPTIAATQDNYFDDMVTIKVGDSLKQEFYAVKSDFDGNIYIGVSDFLVFTEVSEYSKLSIKAGRVSLTIAGNLFSDGKSKQITKNLKSIASLVIDGELYVDRRELDELIPLKQIKWIAATYTLTISPDFSLPLDSRIAAQKRMRGVEDDKNRKQNKQQTDLFMQEDRRLVALGMLKFRYDIDNIANYFENGKKQNKGNVALEYSSQLLYGDFNIRQGIYPIRKLADVSLKYPYIFEGKTVTIGDNNVKGNDILGYNSQIRGLSVSDNGYTVKRSGREVTIRGEAPTNAMVEIYQNGKVADFQRVEGSDYEFTLEIRSKNDAFTIKIFDRNGVFIEERNINVLQGNDFLTKGEWDYNFFYGQNPQSENKAWDDRKYGISYGVTNNLSYSFDYYDTRNEDELYNYSKHRAAYRFSNLFVPLVAQISYYNSVADPSEGYIGELNSEIYSHQLSYSYERYSHLLAEDENKDRYLEAEVSGDYGRSDYFFRFSSKTYQDRTENIYDTGISYDVTKALRVNFDVGKTVRKQNERRSNYTGKIGFDYNGGDFTYNADASYDEGRDAKWEFAARLRKRLSQNSKYAYRLEVNYNKQADFSLEMTFEYRFNDTLKTDSNYKSNRQNQYKTRASYEKVINMKKPFTSNTAKYPDSGYLEGTVFIDKNANGKKDRNEDPLAGVKVGIGKNKAKTDSAGTFYLSDISPYRSNKLRYDYSGIMVDPTLRSDSAQTIALLPASSKNISVGLVPLSLIMGSIYLPEIEAKISNKFFSYVEITVSKDNDYYTSITPEYDGFFVLQDLKPGKYDLKINYLGSEVVTLEKDILTVIVLAGDTGDFYEGIDFNVSGIKTKKVDIVFEPNENRD